MRKVILEDRFDTHQKMIFLIFIGLPFTGIISRLFDSLNFNPNISSFFLITLYIHLVVFAFQKRGFVKKQTDLYSGAFFFDILLRKKRIVLENYNKLAVLKLRKSQKTAWLAGPNPDNANSFNSFEINILNKKHTKRKPIITLKKEYQSNKVIEFLTSNFNLTLETYSPDFS